MRRPSTTSPTSPAAFTAAVDACPISFLTGVKAATFWEEHFEREPRVYEATPARTAWAATLPTTDSLAGRAGLRWGEDVVACRFSGGLRVDLNPGGSHGAPIPRGALARLMAGPGATLQVHHPQRFDDAAWRVVSALERDLGCLVGSNAYLTPGGGAQGLAPHWDDVDVWVVQVEGRKRWRVYAPLEENRGATVPSGDLAPGSRFTAPGLVALDAVLSPGDVLYIPRGAVHEAHTLGGSAVPSNHLTLSAFQRWAVKDLALAAVAAAVGGDPSRAWAHPARPDPVSGAGLTPSARACLGPGAVYGAGYSARCRRARGLVLPTPSAGGKAVADVLRAVADEIDDRRTPLGIVRRRLFHQAWDDLAADFFASRIRPYPTQVGPASAAPTIGCAVAARAPSCFRLGVTVDMVAGKRSLCTVLQSCLANSRAGHMCGGGGGEEDDPTASSEEAGSSEEEEEEEDDDGLTSDEEAASSDASSEDEEADDDDDDDDSAGGGATIIDYKYRHHVATALAATPGSPLRVVADDDRGVRDDGGGGAAIDALPHRVAMLLWNLGAVYVV